MPMVLPVPPPVADEPDATLQQWTQAAPTADAAPQLHIGGGSVVMYRTGPGDLPSETVDEWMGIDLRDLGHNGVTNGREMFVEIPGPPPEGHGGYDIADRDTVIDRSTQHQALFWSDWARSTAAQAGGRGSFTGEHVIIVRHPPGSVQGYMPSDPGMLQANTDRNMPGAWDQSIVVGGPAGAPGGVPGPAAVSM